LKLLVLLYWIWTS